MIVRSVDVDDLKNFDFFNDSDDTIRFLERMNRNEEAEKLRFAFSEWLSKWRNSVRSD
jgi:hypothetical protein